MGQLMRNNFAILETLSNIEGMGALPADATISPSFPPSAVLIENSIKYGTRNSTVTADTDHNAKDCRLAQSC